MLAVPIDEEGRDTKPKKERIETEQEQKDESSGFVFVRLLPPPTNTTLLSLFCSSSIFHSTHCFLPPSYTFNPPTITLIKTITMQRIESIFSQAIARQILTHVAVKWVQDFDSTFYKQHPRAEIGMSLSFSLLFTPFSPLSFPPLFLFSLHFAHFFFCWPFANVNFSSFFLYFSFLSFFSVVIESTVEQLFGIITKVFEMYGFPQYYLAVSVFYAEKFVRKYGVKHNQIFNLLFTRYYY